MADPTAAWRFLQTHLPAEDLRGHPPELFRQFVDHALFLRETAPWCRELDEEIFFHYVLFPRVNDEDLSFHRRIFYDALWPRVRELSDVSEAVLEVNRWCHEIAAYELTDERTASPLTVYRCGSGRCGEESAFLVSALRSVGVPARQVYVPRWSHCDDNHAWVEALCGSAWRYLGACEPEPVLDLGWFNTAASRAVLVHSRLFGAGESPLHGKPVGGKGGVTFYNQTHRYAPVSERTFRAYADGRPAAGAVFRLQILNEASFHTIAELTADKRGEARAELGRGTVHVLALLGGLQAEGDCEDGELVLRLTAAAEEGPDWIDFDFHAAAAAPANAAPLSTGQRAARAETRRKGDSLRAARTAAFYRSDPDHRSWDGLLRGAGENCDELLAFLRGGDARERERLLRTLSRKDLRDVPRAVLEEHLACLPPRPEEIPEDIYWRYVASPRIAREKLCPWRNGRWHELAEPGRLVAARRDAGIPARLRPMDGAPEVWERGAFRPVFAEKTGTLHLAYPGEPPLQYHRHWTLSRQTETGWQVLDLSGLAWKNGAADVTIPVGRYRIITCARLPGGGQLASRRDFSAAEGQVRTISLRLREYALSEMLFCQELPPIPAVTGDGGSIPNVLCLDGSPSLLLWLEEGAEPTEHILSELSSCRPALEKLPLRVIFLLRGRESLRHPALVSLLTAWSSVRIAFDDWAFDLEDTARRLACDPDTPPLAVVCDGRGRAVYASGGYRVGAVDLLAKIAAYVCGQESGTVCSPAL